MNKVLSTVFSNGLEKLGRLLAREKPRQDRRTGTGNSKQRIGARGEDQAVRGLKKQGLKIVEQNFRCKTGEIDIIAKDGNTLVFVEVKTRRTPFFGSPKEAITRTKRERLIRTGLYYLKATNRPKTKFRFDVVAIAENTADGQSQMEWIKNAFAAYEGR